MKSITSKAEDASTREERPQRRGRPKTSSGTAETRVRLLDAAEQLFSERGFYGVTTREVASAAALDDAMIYYHFDNKRGLFDAVLERRARVVHDARHASLVAYVAEVGGAVTVQGAVAAFINPLLDLSQAGDPGWKSYFALVAQIDNTPWGGEIIHHFFDPAVHELIEVLGKALPETPAEELFWAYNFLAGSMMLALAETERVDRLSDGICRAKDISAMRQRLLDYCVGGVLSMIEGRSASV